MSVNFDKVENAVKEAFKEAVLLAGVESTRVMSEARAWRGFSGVRDIVDLGYLRSTQKIVFNNDLQAEIRYTATYAIYVYMGATIRYENGTTRRIPARRWIRIALNNMDFGTKFAELVAAKSK